MNLHVEPKVNAKDPPAATGALSNAQLGKKLLKASRTRAVQQAIDFELRWNAALIAVR